MSNRVCPKCGEEYSDTYRKCPFCEEEEDIRKGKPIRRRGGKRLSKKKRSRGAGGVMMSVAVVVVVCVVALVLWGPQLLKFIGVRTDRNDEVTDPDTIQEDTLPENENGALPADDAEPPAEPGDTTDAPPAAEGPLALDHDTISIPTGEKALLTATGGNGTITWSSSNAEIATVSEGTVTGVAGGTVTVTAVSGEEKVSCTVTVTGEAWVSSADLRLNKTDFTLKASEPPVQMKVKGTESAVSWSSEDPNVAAVSADGVVTWKGKGTTNVVARVDGHELKCIVRCS